MLDQLITCIIHLYITHILSVACAKHIATRSDTGSQNRLIQILYQHTMYQMGIFLLWSYTYILIYILASYLILDTDPCNPSPCVHGRCRAAGSSYSCRCRAGYTGPMCSGNIYYAVRNVYIVEVSREMLDVFELISICVYMRGSLSYYTMFNLWIDVHTWTLYHIHRYSICDACVTVERFMINNLEVNPYDFIFLSNQINVHFVYH